MTKHCGANEELYCNDGQMRCMMEVVERRRSVIELYEKYRLKDGRVGRAVEILGRGEACIFEVDKNGLEDRVITVTQEEIKEKAE